jgi:hypothetical protein
MPRRLLMAALAFAALSAVDLPARAQIIEQAEQDPAAVRYGQAIATRYKVGAKIQAKGGDVQDIFVMVAVPLECAEQEVHVVEEDFSPQVQGVEFRTLPTDKRAEPGARQMLITVPQLAARQEAHALITYEVLTKTILPPEDTSALKAPAKPNRFIKQYLTSSPFINVNHRKIRDAVRDAHSAAAKDKKDEADGAAATEDDGNSIASPGDVTAAEQIKKDETVKPAAASEAADGGAAKFKTDANEIEEPADSAGDAPNDWNRVEELYDYVLKHVDYEEGAADKSALQTLQDGKADCHGIAALFVAMCRTDKVPARMVWVDGHQYAEFYLEDAAGKGHWYPVQSAGTRAFGEMPLPKVILQKGDDFRVPERRRERLRYASDYTMLLSAPKDKPTVKYVREQL